ncbi:rhoptry associated membrane antigen, putative [Medicago truncatula]|uniref:Rhoptry associated membrane antigen, putative n=1 Tax=Medicago truncatula TaxID=3880 RepID=A0A072UAX2_MEDTR|nr:rhoptry associated membrane antigen, putative [Medicago truncatula]
MKRKQSRTNETRPSKTLKTSNLMEGIKNESIETSTKSNDINKILQSFEQLKIVEKENKNIQKLEPAETSDDNEVTLGYTTSEELDNEEVILGYTTSEESYINEEEAKYCISSDEFDHLEREESNYDQIFIEKGETNIDEEEIYCCISSDEYNDLDREESNYDQIFIEEDSNYDQIFIEKGETSNSKRKRKWKDYCGNFDNSRVVYENESDEIRNNKKYATSQKKKGYARKTIKTTTDKDSCLKVLYKGSPNLLLKTRSVLLDGYIKIQQDGDSYEEIVDELMDVSYEED